MPIQDVLAQRLKISRNHAKRLLDTRQVFVNSQRIWMTKHLVDTGDRIEVNADIEEKNSATTCEILWKDDTYIIINKPSGWLSNGPASIEEQLQEQLGRTVHAVHRLDKETSGCMLLAYKKPDMEKMIPVFQKRDVKKIYEGLVIGKYPRDLSVMDKAVNGETAVTLVRSLKQNKLATRVEFTLITGRTHQIRRHLNGYNLFLAGERSYGKTTLDLPVLRNISRHMLHAKTLGFPHPLTEKFVQAKAPLPDDYKKAAVTLGV